MNVKRIYTPVTQDLCITTPYAVIDGKVSYSPMPRGKHETELIEDVKKVGGIVDTNYSLLSKQKGHTEEGQIELTVMLPDSPELPNRGVVKLGVYKNSLKLFPTSPTSTDNLTISGTFGAATLDIIAQLAERGSALIIKGMHIDCDDQKHFTGKMVERQFSHDGSSAGDKNHLYPKPSARDEQTTIRSMENMDVYLDGFGYLEIPVHKGVEVNMTIATTYVK